MSNSIIKDYKHADREALLKIMESNMPKFFADYELAQYDTFLQENKHPYFSVFNDVGQLVGGGGISIDNNEATMCWGMIDAQYHGHGYGKVLTDYRLNLARELIGYGAIMHCNTTQHSYTFFARYGFVVNTIIANGWAPELHRYDMTLVL